MPRLRRSASPSRSSPRRGACRFATVRRARRRCWRRRASAIFLQSQLPKIGIRASIATAASPTAFSAAAAKHQYQAYLWQESPTVANPGLAEQITAACGSSQNYGGYCDPALDALAKKTLAGVPGSAGFKADANALSAMIDANLPAIYLADVTYNVPLAKCAASIHQSAQVKWAPLSLATVSC